MADDGVGGHAGVVDEMRNGKHMLKIMPIFLRTFMREFDDVNNRKVSCWQKLAIENPGRVNVEKCEAAVTYLRAINGLLYDGLSELRFQKEIVDEICRVVPPEVTFRGSCAYVRWVHVMYIQGYQLWAIFIILRRC